MFAFIVKNAMPTQTIVLEKVLVTELHKLFRKTKTCLLRERRRNHFFKGFSNKVKKLCHLFEPYWKQCLMIKVILECLTKIIFDIEDLVNYFEKIIVQGDLYKVLVSLINKRK